MLAILVEVAGIRKKLQILIKPPKKFQHDEDDRSKFALKRVLIVLLLLIMDMAKPLLEKVTEDPKSLIVLGKVIYFSFLFFDIAYLFLQVFLVKRSPP